MGTGVGKHISCSEVSGTVDGVVYSGRETDSGELEIRDNVASMTGVNTAVDGKYAAMLVPWTILNRRWTGLTPTPAMWRR